MQNIKYNLVILLIIIIINNNIKRNTKVIQNNTDYDYSPGKYIKMRKINPYRHFGYNDIMKMTTQNTDLQGDKLNSTNIKDYKGWLKQTNDIIINKNTNTKIKNYPKYQKYDFYLYDWLIVLSLTSQITLILNFFIKNRSFPSKILINSQISGFLLSSLILTNRVLIKSSPDENTNFDIQSFWCKFQIPFITLLIHSFSLTHVFYSQGIQKSLYVVAQDRKQNNIKDVNFKQINIYIWGISFIFMIFSKQNNNQYAFYPMVCWHPASFKFMQIIPLPLFIYAIIILGQIFFLSCLTGRIKNTLKYNEKEHLIEKNINKEFENKLKPYNIYKIFISELITASLMITCTCYQITIIVNKDEYYIGMQILEKIFLVGGVFQLIIYGFNNNNLKQWLQKS